MLFRLSTYFLSKFEKILSAIVITASNFVRIPVICRNPYFCNFFAVSATGSFHSYKYTFYCNSNYVNFGFVSRQIIFQSFLTLGS